MIRQPILLRQFPFSNVALESLRLVAYIYISVSDVLKHRMWKLRESETETVWIIPLLAASMSIIRPGVHTMTSAPRFNSAICSEMPVPPYTQTTCRSNARVNLRHSRPICIASSRVGVSTIAGHTGICYVILANSQRPTTLYHPGHGRVDTSHNTLPSGPRTFWHVPQQFAIRATDVLTRPTTLCHPGHGRVDTSHNSLPSGPRIFWHVPQHFTIQATDVLTRPTTLYHPSYHIISPRLTKAPLIRCSTAPYNTIDRVE